MTDIVVYGRGKTGQSIAKMLQKQGKRTIFFDDVTGFDRPAEFTSDSVVIVSPGVPPAANGIALAKTPFVVNTSMFHNAGSGIFSPPAVIESDKRSIATIR